MTFDRPDFHEQCVDAWLTRERNSAPGSDYLVASLSVGLRALWDRARPALGEVTLGAIFRRAVESARRRHPELSPLDVTVSDRGALEVAPPSLARGDLTAGARFLLVELLHVLARLSSNVLTPALHAALSKASADQAPDLEHAARTDAPNRAHP
jgi:hypothetical protein